MGQSSHHAQKLHRRDAGLRSVKNLTAWTALGSLAMTGLLSVAAERTFPGKRSVTVEAADTASPIAPASSTPIVTAAPTVPTAPPVSEALSPDPNATVAAVPIAPPTVAPTAPPTTVAHHEQHATTTVVSGGS